MLIALNGWTGSMVGFNSKLSIISSLAFPDTIYDTLKVLSKSSAKSMVYTIIMSVSSKATWRQLNA